MQFYNPENFLFLWIVPVLIALFVISRRIWREHLARFGNPKTLETKLIPDYRPVEWNIRALFLLLAFLFATFALARPQWGEEKRKIQRKGVDIVFLLDTSLSMLAEDVKPNRLEKSRLEIKTFIKHLKGDRVGMVAFAGSGFLQTPLTLDYAAFLLFLDGIKPGYIPDPGTSLKKAIRLALSSFPKENLKHKVMVLFTDGEDHEGGIDTLLPELKKAGVRTYTMGVGTAQGEPIPLRNEQGKRTGFKKDSAGQVVLTRLNQPLLEKIAAETAGLYFPSTPGEQEVDLILRHIETLGQKKFKEQMIAEREDHFQFFLFWAIFFLMLELVISRRKTIRSSRQLLVPALLFFATTGFLDNPKGLSDKAGDLYEQKRYQSAAELYRKAKTKKPEDPAVRYNLGTTLYQLQGYQESAKELEKAIDGAKDPKVKAKAWYNYGNAQYRLGNFEKAIEAYQKVLEIDPTDKDAKYNLEFLQKEKSLFEKKNEQRKKQQNQQQNQQQQQQQKNQQQNQQQNQDQQQNEQGGQEDDRHKEGEEEQDQPRQEKTDEQEPKPTEPEEEQKPQEDQDNEERPQGGEPNEQKAPRPLQGQMTIENALQILDAMRESEKELQDLRRPSPPQEPRPVAKDW